METVRTDDDCPIAWSSHGEGEPLLLIPGLGGLGSFWSGVIGGLDGFRCLTFDHRGCGASGRPTEPSTIERIATDALAVMDAAGVVRAHIIGHSTGGAIARELASKYPVRVGRLVLSGTWDRPDARFRLIFENRLEVLERAGAVAYQRQTAVLCLPPAWINAHQAEVGQAIAAADDSPEARGIGASRLRMLLNWPGLPRLQDICAPTLVVAATDDVLIPFHHAERIVSEIEGARLVALTGGHFYPRIDPPGFIAAVAPFLRGHDGDAA